MIYIVALGVGLKCQHKIHLNTTGGGGYPQRKLNKQRKVLIRDCINERYLWKCEKNISCMFLMKINIFFLIIYYVNSILINLTNKVTKWFKITIKSQSKATDLWFRKLHELFWMYIFEIWWARSLSKITQ